MTGQLYSSTIRLEVEAARRAVENLFPYGGQNIGFKVAVPTGEYYAHGTDHERAEKISSAVGLLVARIVSVVSDHAHVYVPERVGAVSAEDQGEHTDGLNILDYFLQIHTLHPGDGVTGVTTFRNYRLTQRGVDVLVGQAGRYANDENLLGPVETISTITRRNALRDAQLIRSQIVSQLPFETLVFVNGYPADRTTPPDIYTTHEFKSTKGWTPVNTKRTITIGRVEKAEDPPFVP